MKLQIKKIQKSFVLQHDQSDCGIACLLSIIKYYGGANSLERLRELSGTTKEGTTLLGLFQAASSLQMKAQGCEADINALLEHGKPVILHVIIDKRLKHYVVYYGYQDGQFIIGDPAKGIVHYSEEELKNIWRSKSCLILEPTLDFQSRSNLYQSKKKWFLQLLRDDFDILKISIGLGLAIAILGMAMAIFSQKLIDDILPSKDFNKLITGIFLVAFLLIVRTGFSALRDYFLTRQSKDFNNRIIDRFFGSLLRLPKPFFDTRKVGELVARLNDTRRVQRVISSVIGAIIIDTLIVLVSFIFLFYYSWQTGVISLISLPFYFFLIYKANNKIIRAQKETMEGYAYSEANFISTIQGIATIKNTNKEQFFQEQNKKIYGNYQAKSYRLGIINVRLGLFSGIFGIAFLISVLSFNALQVYNKMLLLGELMAILGIAGNLLPSVASLALVTIPINEAKVAFNRMFEYTGMQKEISGKVKLEEFTSLEIKKLSFRFPGRSQLIKSINLKLNRGECIAIIGESGCGKSTLGQIIQQFYKHENGSITINDVYNLEDIDLESWRNNIGVVPQEIHIFDGNVLDNIVLGQKEAYPLAIQFCQSYGFEQFFEKLPQGYGTLLGENGINLSGGQKQLIGFARALFRDPAILLLDEATGAMDRKTEHFILNLLQQELLTETSILLISHRLHTINNFANRIYIIENRTILNSGTHNELLLTNNFYSEYWNNILSPLQDFSIQTFNSTSSVNFVSHKQKVKILTD